MSESNSESNFSNIDYMSLIVKSNSKHQQYDDASQVNHYPNGRVSPLSRLIYSGNEREIRNVHSQPNASASVPLIVEHNQVVHNPMLTSNAGFSNNSNLVSDGAYLQRSNSAMQIGSGASHFNANSSEILNPQYENNDRSFGSYYTDATQYSALDNMRSTSSTPYMLNSSQQQYQLYQQQLQQQLHFQQQMQMQQQHSYIQPQQYQQQMEPFSQTNIIYKYQMDPSEYTSTNSQMVNNIYTPGNYENTSNNTNNLSRPTTPNNVLLAQNSSKAQTPSVDFSNKEPEPTRTLFLSNIPSTTTSKTILNHVKLGIVQQLLILPEINNNRNIINNSTETICAKLTFINLNHAIEFYYDAILKKLTIDDNQIQVSYTNEQLIGPLTMKLLNMPEFKPTRNLFISGLYDQENEEALQRKLILDLASFGPIDHIKIIYKKGIAFIHFLDIEDCIKVFLSLKTYSKYYELKKIGFGRDRCEFVTITEKYNATVASSPSLLANGNQYFGDGNRTIFLGNLPPQVTMTDICNTIRGGTLEKINLINEKNICFITFVDPVSACNFFTFYQQNILMILNKKIKVSWGKHSGELKSLLKLAILKGASRNIYIGGLKLGKCFNKDNKKETFSEFNIRKKFGKFGELEQINFLIAKDCFFVNFAEIQSAIECLDKIRDDPLYRNLQVNFGKDRVANRPRH